MSQAPIFKAGLRKPVCIKGISEDSLRELIDAIEITLVNENQSFVTASNGVGVKFLFGQDASVFNGVVARIGSQNVTLIPGYEPSNLFIFRGPPTSSVPGPGWKIESDLTKSVFGQSEDEALWTIFLASRDALINP